MASNYAPPTTPKRNHLAAPLDPAKFTTSVSGTISSMVSDDAIFVPKLVIQTNHKATDLQLRKTIPVDAFLVGMGVLENTLEKNDDLVSTVASHAHIEQLRTTYGKTSGEKSRYGHFCKLVNSVIDKLTCKRAIFTRNDPKIIGSPYVLGELRPDVVALQSNHVDVSNGKWMRYSTGGPLQHFGAIWDWSDVLLPVEFRKQKGSFLPEPSLVSYTLTPWERSPSALLDSTRSSHPSLSSTKRRTRSGAFTHVSPSSSKRQRKLIIDDTVAVPIPFSTSENKPKGPPKRRGKQKSSGKATAAFSRSTSVLGSRNPETVPVLLPGFNPPLSLYNAPSAERKESVLENMKKEDEDVGEAEDPAEAKEELEKRTICEDLEVNGVKYAIDIMSCVPNRRHVFELLITDGIMRLAYYDRAGPVYSYPLHFIADIYRFVLLLKRLAEMDRPEIGFLECMYVDQAPTEEFLKAIGPYADTDQGVCEAIHAIKSGKLPWTLKFDDNTLVFLITEIGDHRHPGLIGKGTSVFLCYLVSPDATGLFAVKLSWPQAQRKSEAEILEEARAALLDVDVDSEFQKVYGVRKLAESLPLVITAKDLDDLKKENSFRWRTRNFYNCDEESNRILRGIFFERLFPLHSVTTLDHFKTAIRDLVLVHHFLWTSKCRILHRDISLRNLMVRYYPGTDVIKGVLIDFDLASVGIQSADGHIGKRTGTRPYVARELLRAKPPTHLERFDWESFFYVICWIGSHYSHGEEVEADAFNEWDEQDDDKLQRIKGSLLAGTGNPDLRTMFTYFYKPLILLWMRPLQLMFRDGDDAREELKSRHPDLEDNTVQFDEKTLDGRITWERFWGILK